MITIRKIQREIQVLPQNELEEVWFFMLFLKSKKTVPPDEEPSPEAFRASNQNAWNVLETVGQTLSAAWDQEKTAAAAVAEIRR